MPNPVGFIGLGRMGRPMASNLQRKGFATLVHDLNPDGVAVVTALGGRAAGSAAEVAAGADIVFTMLPASAEVRFMLTRSASVAAGAHCRTAIAWAVARRHWPRTSPSVRPLLRAALTALAS